MNSRWLDQRFGGNAQFLVRAQIPATEKAKAWLLKNGALLEQDL
jgi:hypothetical protein